MTDCLEACCDRLMVDAAVLSPFIDQRLQPPAALHRCQSMALPF
jgi:hypothetical protein